MVGWTDPEGSRVALGALLLAYHDGDDLVYAGKVGTGFSQSVLRDLHARLTELEVDESPVHEGLAAAEGRALGAAPSWWPRSRSPSGPARTSCGIPASSGCGRTRRRRTW